MQKVVNFLLGLAVVVVGLSIVLGWFWGIPYIATLVFDQSYWFFATIWLSIHLIRNIAGRIKLQNQIKQYAEIHKILGGKE
jgi:hypothetical protein